MIKYMVFVKGNYNFMHIVPLNKEQATQRSTIVFKDNIIRSKIQNK